VKTFKCSKCGEQKEIQHSGGTGYALDSGNKKVCYACCAIADAEDMKTGKATLYLSYNGQGVLSNAGRVTNWSGTLIFNARVRIGRHNIAGKRYDAWFIGPNMEKWHGVQYGDNTQICHCKRVSASNCCGSFTIAVEKNGGKVK
jgi:hypothetical protein